MATKTDSSASDREQKSENQTNSSISSNNIESGITDTGKSKNGEVKDVQAQKKPSKLSLLGRIFRPWKWRRKKKSEKIEKKAIDLERKISVRTSREELIRKGVIKEREEVIQAPRLEKVDESHDEPEIVKNTNNGAAGDPAANAVVDDIKLTEKLDPSSQNGDTGEPPPALPVKEKVAKPEVINCTMTPSGDASSVVHEATASPVVVEASQKDSVASEPVTDLPTSVVPDQPAEVAPAPSTGPILIRFQTPMKDHTVNDDYDVPPPLPSTSPPHDDCDYDNVLPDEMPVVEAGPRGYEEIPASEPNLNLLPKKSALKGANQGSQARPLMKPTPKPRSVRVPVRVVETNESSTGDYDNLPGDDSSSDEENIRYRDDDDDESWAAKVARKDSLARFLNNRPGKRELIEKNIIPSQTDEEKDVQRKQIGTKLFRRLSLRPTQEELEQRNILHCSTENQRKIDLEETRKSLVRKLSFRPTIEELKQRQIIQFSDYVEVTDAQEYDRRGDKPWTRLTPRDKAAIRKELNEFKGTEMDIHEESKQFTRFHRP